MSQREIDGRTSMERYARRMKDVNVSWMDDAACSPSNSPGSDPSLFWLPSDVGGGRRSKSTDGRIQAQINTAMAVCRSCPVQVECLDYANRIRPSGGIWGGVLFPEITNTRAGWRARKAAREATG